MPQKKNQHTYIVASKKNLRRINIVVTAQTLGHLEEMAAANGWGEKDLGRVVDKLMRSYLVSEPNSGNTQERSRRTSASQ